MSERPRRHLTIGTRRLLEEYKRTGPCVDYPAGIQRPATRADCEPGGLNEARPCPWVSCRYHLYLDALPNGSLRINNADVGPEELERMRATCALDVASEGEHTEEVTAEFAGLGSSQAFQAQWQRTRETLRDALNGHGLEMLEGLAASADESTSKSTNFELATDLAVTFTGPEAAALKRLKGSPR